MIPRSVFIIVVIVGAFCVGFGLHILTEPAKPAKLETKATFKKRYFIVTYDTGDVTGTTSVETNDGLYFSYNQFQYDIGKKCAILFVQELSKDDYDKFYSSFSPEIPLIFKSSPSILRDISNKRKQLLKKD